MLRGNFHEIIKFLLSGKNVLRGRNWRNKNCTKRVEDFRSTEKKPNIKKAKKSLNYIVLSILTVKLIQF